ncbi:class I SAM-dependent methyltransferase [Alkalimonas collagenimarina]|uniref:Class I SAM-dependent methyltransferase n=1 Tax=Alkalimonas collagenimarina TaxID=400390 RepID=A0ABT9GUM6_9GAMM|nr:class I SAM-dependent methyltransferase [Alkalimonas collagenimarina]MDP4534747.1 class I SAM-dependent methyltransferase [Alkalimonas collagenimarina]
MQADSVIIEHFSNTAGTYDKKNLPLSTLATTLHFLIGLILQPAPARARVLCVGVGTGAEILSLAQSFPQWTFVGIDPAKGMLEVCAERLSQAGILDRCELIHGYVQDLPPGEHYDVVLSILVAHFVKREDRLGFYQAMWQRLSNNGFFVSAELSYDLNADGFPLILKNWQRVQALMGASADSLEKLPAVLREQLTIISPTDTEALLKQCGIAVPVRFFQAFMISGWYGIKSDEIE